MRGETGLYKLNGGSGRRHAVVNPASLRIGLGRRTNYTIHIRKNTPKSKSPLTDPQMEKKYVFRNPRDAI